MSTERKPSGPTSKKTSDGPMPNRQDEATRRTPLPSHKASTPSVRHSNPRLKSSSTGPNKKPAKLLLEDKAGRSLSSDLSRKPSITPGRPSTSNGKSSTAVPKRKPPKLPPKRGDESRPTVQARKSSAVLQEEIRARMKQMDSQQDQENPSTLQVSEEQQDLKSILSASQCQDLVKLTSSIISRMRNSIESNFDATATLEKLRLEGSGEDNLAKIDFDPGTVDVEEYDKERKLRDERLKELSRPKVQEMKKYNLRWFDNWKIGFLKRVTDALTPGTAPLQQQQGQSEALPARINNPSEENVRSAPPKLEQLFPRVRTSLTKLPIARRELILHSFLLLLLSLENYTAASRVFLLYLTSSLKLGLKSLREDEEKTAKGLLLAAKEISASKETVRKSKESEDSRKWKMRLATVAGAAIVGLSGGYAAPMIAASVSTMMSELGLGASAAAGYLGSVAGNTYLVGSLFGAYGGRMTSEMMRNLSADVQDFAFLPVHGERKEHRNSVEAATANRRLRVTIVISGWLLEKEEVLTPWRVLSPSTEVFALRFELETLMNLGQSINTMSSNTAYGYAQSAFATRAAYTELSSVIWPIALVKVARVIENPFSLAKFRADKAGKVLAEALINRTQGERPVTLVGYSLGARVIWSCLTTLAEHKAFGLVESAVLIGSPSPSDISTWRLMRTAVSGRLVNVYSANDYLLAFLHRASSLQYGVAGLSPVPGLSGVENFDVSDTVSGHLRYRYLVGAILQKIGFEGLDKVEINKEAETFKTVVEEEKKHDLVQEAKDGAGELYKQYGRRGKQVLTKKMSNADADKQASAMEKEVQQKTQKGLMQWAVEQLYISRPSISPTKDLNRTISNPQSRTGGTAMTAERNVDKASKSVYQRAKEAVYLTRSGGSEGQDAAKGKIAEAENAASSAAPSWYLATAAGYIPTGYIPTLRAAGKDIAAAGLKGKATKKASAAAKKQPLVGDGSKFEKNKPEKAKRQRSSTVQSKPGGARKDTGKEPASPEETTENAEEGKTSASAPETSNVAEDAMTSTAKTTENSGQKSADQGSATGGMTSYIPSFGLGSSSKSSKSSVPAKTPSTSAESGHPENDDDAATDDASKFAQKAAEGAQDHDKRSITPRQKASGYSSYIPLFPFGSSSSCQTKAPETKSDGKDTEGYKEGPKEGLEDPFID